MGQIQIDFINAAGSLRLTLAFGIHPLVSFLRPYIQYAKKWRLKINIFV
jgi:hypothetical protein